MTGEGTHSVTRNGPGVAVEGDLAVKIAQLRQLVMFPRPVLEILPSLPTLYQGHSAPRLSQRTIGAPVSWTCLSSEHWALPCQPQRSASLGPLWLGDGSPHLWQGELEDLREGAFSPFLTWGPLCSLEGWG